MDKAKPFSIAKREVWEAFKQVKANRGAAGVDGQSIEDFERDLSNNLYRIWNRMSSGTYFPPPVRRVDIPKGDSGKTRPLGIPAVADRIAQTVVKRYLEPILEPKFHKDSYGYRRGKSAHDALAVARQRCWQRDWVLDLDIESSFDRIDWELLIRAVRHHTDCKWVLLYIERWLKAPVSMPDGTLVNRERGTPQGSVISPVLANLFLHYAFDCLTSIILAGRIDSRFLLPSRRSLPHVNCYPAAQELRGGGGDGEATEHGDTARAEGCDQATISGNY